MSVSLLAFNPPLPIDLYWAFTFIFTVVGIAAFVWLIFFIETSRDLSKRDRIVGLANRILTASLSLGIALTFWGLVRLY